MRGGSQVGRGKGEEEGTRGPGDQGDQGTRTRDQDQRDKDKDQVIMRGKFRDIQRREEKSRGGGIRGRTVQG